MSDTTAAAQTTQADPVATAAAASASASQTQTAAAAQTTQADPAATAAAATPQAPAFAYPDAVPEHLRGKDPNEAIAKLWGALDPMIRANSERGAKVETADGYKWTPPEQFVTVVGDQAKDPMINAAKQAALASGMTDKQYQNFMSKMTETLAAGQKEFGGGWQPETNEQIKTGNYAWIDNVKAQGKMSVQAIDALDMLTASKGGSEIIALLQASITPGFAVAPASGAGAAGFGAEPQNAAEARKLVADPRYMTDSPKYDKAYRTWADNQAMRFVSAA